MIDLEDFAEEYEAALKAADEYQRRAAKGLPTDRWTDGAAGARLVAQGIRAQQAMLQLYAQFAREVLESERERGAQAMEASRDPFR